MRCFIAIELPPSIRQTITAVSARTRERPVKAQWVKSENLHLTLRFLGDISNEQAVRVGDALAEACPSLKPFSLRIQRVGAFPNSSRPNVVWVGARPLEGGLLACHDAAEVAAQSIGLAKESRAYHPHITVARIRNGKAKKGWAKVLEAEQNFDGGAFTVAAVSLFQSRLTPQGAIYTRLRNIPL
jgi:2'-5' RNA ligase